MRGGRLCDLPGIVPSCVGVDQLALLVSTFLIDRFDLSGFRQACLGLTGQTYMPIPFQAPCLYRLVPHPIACDAAYRKCDSPAFGLCEAFRVAREAALPLISGSLYFRFTVTLSY